MESSRALVVAGHLLAFSSLAPWAAAEDADAGYFPLGSVAVTAPRFRPANITVITDAAIKAKGAQTVAEALQGVPGLSITSNNGKAKQVAQFRGSDADNTKVFIDGVVLSPVGDQRVDLSNIPTELIARIEVIKGPVPAIYGTDAPGGIIYITTKSGGHKTSGSVSVALGSWETKTYSANIGGEAGRVNYLFNIKKKDSDGYTSHNQSNATYYNGKVSINLGQKSSLSVYGAYSEADMQIPNRYNASGTLMATPGQGGAIGNNNFFTGTYDWSYDPMRNAYLGLSYKYAFSDANEVTLKAFKSRENSTLNTNNTKLHDFWDGSVSGVEIQHSMKLHKINTLTWGYAYEDRKFNDLAINSSLTNYLTAKGGYCPSDYRYHSNSLYLQDTLSLGNRLLATLGYRYYNVHDRMNINSASYANGTSSYTYLTNAGVDPFHLKGDESSNNLVFNVNYALTSKANLHGAIGRSFRFPDAKERAGVGGFYSGQYNVGGFSTYLLPERALNREIGLAYAVTPDFGGDVTIFHKDVYNMIKGQGQSIAHTQYENLPHVDMHGFEYEIHDKITKNLKVFGNYSYTNAYDVEQKRQVTDIPFRKFTYGLDYEKDGLTVSVSVDYVGAVKSAWTLGNGNGDGDGGPTVTVYDLPGYHLTNLKIGKSIDNVDCYIRVNNLFDKTYQLGAYLAAPQRYVELGTTIRFK